MIAFLLCVGLIGGCCAQSSINLAQELAQTKFSNIECDPFTNSIVTDVVNGVVSQSTTQFLYQGTCSNQQLLFSPSNVRVAAGLTTRINGTLVPLTATTDIIGQACSLSLTAVIEAVDSITGTTVQVNQIADTLQFACGNVEIDDGCDWADIPCYWTEQNAADSSFFWMIIYVITYAVIIALYYLAYQLPLVQTGTIKSRRQYSYMEEHYAKNNKEVDEKAKVKASEVIEGEMTYEELKHQKELVEEELAEPSMRRYIDMIEREEYDRVAGRTSEPRQSSAGWTLNFNLPNAMANTFSGRSAGSKASGYEDLRASTDDYNPYNVPHEIEMDEIHSVYSDRFK